MKKPLFFYWTSVTASCLQQNNVNDALIKCKHFSALRLFSTLTSSVDNCVWQQNVQIRLSMKDDIVHHTVGSTVNSWKRLLKRQPCRGHMLLIALYTFGTGVIFSQQWLLKWQYKLLAAESDNLAKTNSSHPMFLLACNKHTIWMLLFFGSMNFGRRSNRDVFRLCWQFAVLHSYILDS